MLNRLQSAILPSKASHLAGSFRRLGWAGFWLQIVFGSIPIVVMVYYFAFARPLGEPRGGLAFVEYLTIANVLFLLFTIVWSYRYTRLASRLQDSERRPTKPQVISIVWTGLVASAAGMLFSMLVLLIEAAQLLFHFLKAPQGGIPIVQTSGAATVQFVSTVDMVSLLALILTLFAELLVLVISLWLLFRTTLGAAEWPEAAAGN